MDVATSELAPVYLDEERIRLQGDPRPSVAKIGEAAGKRGGRFLRLRSKEDGGGEPVTPNEVIDRTRAKGPVYLRSDPGEAGPPQATGEDFGAARPGMAGQGAEGTLERGRLGDPAVTPPVEAQAKSDYVGADRGGAAPSTATQDGRGSSSAVSQGDPFPGQRPAGDSALEGGSNESYGAGDLAPGGRSSADGGRAVGVAQDAGHAGPPPGSIAGSGEATAHAGETGTGSSGSKEAPIPGDEGIGATNRRQAGRGTASGADDPDNQAQGGLIRDQSTDHSGRQQTSS